MLFTIKTLQQKSFQIEANPSVKVSEFKELIHASQGFPSEHQKLIFSGKILADDAPMAQYNIAEKDFLVVMVSKPKPTASTSAAPPVAAAAPAPAPAAPVPTPASTAPVTGTAPPAAATPAAAPDAAAAPAAPVETAFDASTLATGASYNAAVANLVEMGFPRDQVLRAMRAAFNNPDRAAEYLMTGIPAGLGEPEPAPRPAAPAGVEAPGNAPVGAGNPLNLFEASAASAAAGGEVPAPSAAQSAAALDGIRNSPQFQQLRQLIQAQPQLLQPILQQLGQSNPELLQIIAQNPEAFMQLLGGDMGDMGGEYEGEEEEGAEGTAGQGGPVTITITPQENEAVERLVALGFDRHTALEAFLACDKNEELAANYLFENQF